MSFCSFKKGINPKICILRFDLINSVLLNPSCVWILFWNTSSYSCFAVLIRIQSCTLCLLPNSAFRISDLLIYPTSHSRGQYSCTVLCIVLHRKWLCGIVVSRCMQYPNTKRFKTTTTTTTKTLIYYDMETQYANFRGLGRKIRKSTIYSFPPHFRHFDDVVLSLRLDP